MRSSCRRPPPGGSGRRTAPRSSSPTRSPRSRKPCAADVAACRARSSEVGSCGLRRDRAAPGHRVGADVVAGVDDEHDDRLGERVLAPDVELVQVRGPPRGHAPVDPPQPVAGRERVHVAQPAALAGPSGLVGAGQPAQPRRQRQVAERTRGGQHQGGAGRPTGSARTRSRHRARHPARRRGRPPAARCGRCARPAGAAGCRRRSTHASSSTRDTAADPERARSPGTSTTTSAAQRPRGRRRVRRLQPHGRVHRRPPAPVPHPGDQRRRAEHGDVRAPEQRADAPPAPGRRRPRRPSRASAPRS